MKRFRGGLVFEVHRLSYHSTLGSRVIEETEVSPYEDPRPYGLSHLCIMKSILISLRFAKSQMALRGTPPLQSSKGYNGSNSHPKAGLSWPSLPIAGRSRPRIAPGDVFVSKDSARTDSVVSSTGMRPSTARVDLVAQDHPFMTGADSFACTS